MTTFLPSDITRLYLLPLLGSRPYELIAGYSGVLSSISCFLLIMELLFLPL